MPISETATRDRIFNTACKHLGLTRSADRASLPRPSYEHDRKLFVIAFGLELLNAQKDIKAIQFPDVQTECFFDMIVAGKIDQVLKIIETAAGEPIYTPLPRDLATASITTAAADRPRL